MTSIDRQRTPMSDIQVVTVPVVYPQQKFMSGVAPLIVRRTIFSDREIPRVFALLQDAAYAVGADAVVGVQVSVSDGVNGSQHVVATGTPVVLPWPHGHGIPAYVEDYE